MATIGVAIIGSGGIALANHMPGLALCPDVKVVAVCDNDAATLEKAKATAGVTVGSTDWKEIVGRSETTTTRTSPCASMRTSRKKPVAYSALTASATFCSSIRSPTLIGR